MKRLNGPKIELSQLKVPPIARDVYQDLRDRRLLPLVALVLVAIVAVPFLLSSGGAEPSEEAAPVAPEAAIETSDIEVVKATPGLREPGKRLASRRAKDPFRQHFTGAAVSTEAAVSAPSTTTTVTGGGGSGGSAGGAVEPPPSPGPSATAPPAPPAETPSSGGDGGSGGSGGDPGSGKDGSSGPVVFYTYAADLKIVKTETDKEGKKTGSETEERKRVLPSTVLPSPKQQVVTYMGISPKTRKPLFLVSTDVTAIFGDAKCASGTDTCQLLEMEPTFPEAFLYGENGVRFKITVLDIEPVVVDKSGHS
jgi:hypothetical protein